MTKKWSICVAAAISAGLWFDEDEFIINQIMAC